jgi:acyl-CoA synthetase (AMP-forming)/AMP-acid ligase II
MLGYWRDPEATRLAIKDGWLRTGDLALTDGEGYFFLKVRKNELVKIRGFRTHPREVEDAVLQRFPTAQAVVVPYEFCGATRLALYLVPHEKQDLTVDQVRRQCLIALPRPKLPTHIELLPCWPLNGAGKVDRPALRQRAEAWASEFSPTPPTSIRAA